MACEGEAFLPNTEGVFYSPLQRLQRDLTLEVVRQHVRDRAENGEYTGLDIVDALTGCGTRALRYALELDGINSVTANDLEPSAIAALQDNLAASLSNAAAPREAEPPRRPHFIVKCSDARSLLGRSPAGFDVVDLDPCGSPCPYIAPAVRAVKSGGILLVAFTDARDLCGDHGGEGATRSYSRYGGWVGMSSASSSPSTPSSPASASAFRSELAMRVVVSAVERAASANGRRIEVLCCFALDFFFRIVVRIMDSPGGAAISPPPPLLVWTPSSCSVDMRKFAGMFTTTELGEEFKPPLFGEANILGPIFGGELYDSCFLGRMLARMQATSVNNNRGGSSSAGTRTIRLVAGGKPEQWFEFGIYFEDGEEKGTEVNEDMDATAPNRHAHFERLKRLRLTPSRSNAEGERRAAAAAVSLVHQLVQDAQVPSLFSYSIREAASACGFSTSYYAVKTMKRDTVLRQLHSQGHADARACYTDTHSIKTTTACHADVCEAVQNVLKLATTTTGSSSSNSSSSGGGCGGSALKATRDAVLSLSRTAVTEEQLQTNEGTILSNKDDKIKRKKMRVELPNSTWFDANKHEMAHKMASFRGDTVLSTAKLRLLGSSDYDDGVNRESGEEETQCCCLELLQKAGRIYVVEPSVETGCSCLSSGFSSCCAGVLGGAETILAPPLVFSRCTSLSEGIRMATNPGDCLFLLSGEHLTPPGGLRIEVTGISLVGCKCCRHPSVVAAATAVTIVAPTSTCGPATFPSSMQMGNITQQPAVRPEKNTKKKSKKRTKTATNTSPSSNNTTPSATISCSAENLVIDSVNIVAAFHVRQEQMQQRTTASNNSNLSWCAVHVEGNATSVRLERCNMYSHFSSLVGVVGDESRGGGLVVASRASATLIECTIDGRETHVGRGAASPSTVPSSSAAAAASSLTSTTMRMETGVLVCGRATISLTSTRVAGMGSCGVLVQSGGSAFLGDSSIYNCEWTGAAVSGLGSALAMDTCNVGRCGRVFVEASNRSRVDLRRCNFGGGDGGANNIVEVATTAPAPAAVAVKKKLSASSRKSNQRGDGEGSWSSMGSSANGSSALGRASWSTFCTGSNAGSGGGGIFIRHCGTSAVVKNCVVASTRYASVDVREGARLLLVGTLLTRGRTSGVFASKGAFVAIGPGCAFIRFKLAALEVSSKAQILCSSHVASGAFSVMQQEQQHQVYEGDSSEEVTPSSSLLSSPMTSSPQQETKKRVTTVHGSATVGGGVCLQPDMQSIDEDNRRRGGGNGDHTRAFERDSISIAACGTPSLVSPDASFGVVVIDSDNA